MMENKRPLIFAVVLRSSEEVPIEYDQLVANFRQFNFSST